MNKPVFIKVDTSKWFGWITETPDSLEFRFLTPSHQGVFYKAPIRDSKDGTTRVAVVIPFVRKV